MPSIDELLAGYGAQTSATGSSDINAFNNTVLQSDPFNIAGQGLAAWRPDYSTWSPAATGITAFGKAFLSGLLGDKARSDAADQTTKLAAILPQLDSAGGVNVMAPEGVDQGAFNTFKLSRMEKRQTSEEQIRRALATTLGLNYDPSTGGTSEIPGVQEAMANVATDKAIANAKNKVASAIGQKSTVAVAKDLSGTIAAIDALNRASDKVSKFPGGPGTMGGVINWFDKLIPNEPAYQYNKDLPLLNDPLTVGLSGTSKQGTLNQMKAALTQDFGQSTDSQLATLNEAKAAMADKVTKYIETLKAAGWPEADAPAGYHSLNDIRDMFDKVSKGQPLDNNPFLQSQTAPAAGQLPDQRTFAQNAKAKGLTIDQARAAWAALGGQ